MARIQVVEIQSPAKSKEFIGFPWTVYPDNSAWVPPIRKQVQDMLNTDKHPFYKTNEIKAWMAKDANGKPLARLAAIFPKEGKGFAKF
ncbi:MAG: hypothetical protein KA715_14430 [Xanthomonadaceae bacterium]|nr:hypothetical protein [Xanthomonadaceae bacterium]